MLENLKFNFSFIGVSETWATIMNQDVLNITNYNHEQCIRNKKRNGGGTSLNPVGTGGVLDMCLCFGCGAVGGVCREWVGGLDQGRERWGGVMYV